MRLRIQQVNVPLQANEPDLLQRISRKLGCPPGVLSDVVILRRSLDVRPRNPEPTHVLTVEATYSRATLPPSASPPVVEIIPESPPPTESPLPPLPSGAPRPIVVGAGPAGLMAAYQLAKAGARPLLIDRGKPAADRAPQVAAFWNQGQLDPESNVLFGEGGAGLFSDGKLTARSKERVRVRQFMEILHACGADASVTIDAAPHIGSDRLMHILPRIREEIITAGGEVQFESRLDDLVIEKGQLRAVVLNGEERACTACVLAAGHSARDVVTMLARRGVALQAKPFAVGVRLEVPQPDINRSQYGRFSGNPLLGAANFRLTRRGSDHIRPCYSFCMCPGGRVIACASEPGRLTTNGMSYASRSMPMGNAAFLVPVDPADYPPHATPALAGMEFQRNLERAAFEAGGDDYAVPAVRLMDFLSQQVSPSLPEGGSCTRVAPVEFRSILPDFVIQTLEASLPPMLKELKPVQPEDAVLYGPETRSSSPLWVLRTAEGESENTRGLFPAGEGAGYAGGIVSSAVDGMKIAEQVERSLRA